MLRHGRGRNRRAHLAAVGMERAGGPGTSPGTKIDLLAVAPKTVGFWVDQASLTWSGSSAQRVNAKGPLFLESHQASARSWKAGWVVALASQRDTMFPPLLRVPGPADGAWTCKCLRRCDRPHDSLEPQLQGTVRSRHFPSGALQQSRPVMWHGRPIFTDGSSADSGALRRAGWAAVAIDDLGNLQVSGLWDGAERRAAFADVAAQWRGLRCLRGRHHGPSHAAHRLRGHRRNDQRAKVQGLGSRVPWSTCLEQASWLPDEVRAINIKGHATQRDVEAGRSSHLSTRSAFAKKGADTHTQACVSGGQRQSLLVPPWPSKRLGGQRRPTSC